jgi:hypothetical protein
MEAQMRGLYRAVKLVLRESWPLRLQEKITPAEALKLWPKPEK